jgi:hypothetical protein
MKHTSKQKQFFKKRRKTDISKQNKKKKIAAYSRTADIVCP